AVRAGRRPMRLASTALPSARPGVSLNLSDHSVSAGEKPAAAHTLTAVLWDMDGTLVDSEPYWLAAERDLVEAAGATCDREILQHRGGSALMRRASLQRDWFALDLAPQVIVHNLIAGILARRARDGVPWRPGARELLLALGEAGVP